MGRDVEELKLPWANAALALARRAWQWSYLICHGIDFAKDAARLNKSRAYFSR